MKNRSEDSHDLASLREKLVGLGESSVRKTYYPELQQRLEDLRASEEFLKNIVENIPAMVFAKDAADLRYVALNKTGEELLGYASGEILGRTDYDLFPKEQADFFTTRDREALREGHLVEIAEESIRTRGGGDRILRVKKIPLYDNRGKARYVLGIAEDITERKRLEEQLLQSQKMEAVGHLASGVAHDFNNILMVILGYGNMLKRDDALDAEQKQKIDVIMDASEKAAQLTRNLLAFGRKQQIKPRVADLNQIVMHIQEFLERIIGEDVQLRTFVTVEELLAEVDSGQIEQVLINLATNARDAMHKGGELTIRTELRREVPRLSGVGSGQSGRYAVILVTDSGAGMDEATRKRIFEPFFTTKEPGKGTGLGLAIVYGIVKEHNGFIDVRSEPHKGTTFSIHLPLLDRRPGAVEETVAPEPTQGGGETILVAEDDEMVLAFMRDILGGNGYKVILASDGRDAVEKYARNAARIKLVLMDLVMPGMNGKEAADRMRELNPGVRIIYTSGYTMDIIESRDTLVDEGSLLIKPVPPLELLQRVREELDR